MNSFNTMPTEIVLGIFKFADRNTLCRVGSVSHLLHEISCDKEIWEPLIKARFPRIECEQYNKHTYARLAEEEQARLEKYRRRPVYKGMI